MSFVEFVMPNKVTITLNTSFPTPVSALAWGKKLAFTKTIANMKPEARDDHAHAAVGQFESVRDDGRVEELHFVDPHDVESVRMPDDLGDRRHGYGAHSCTGVADDVGRVVAVVDPRLEDDDALPCDLRASQTADHLLALAAEHRAADDLEPATSLRGDPDHGGDPSEPIGRHSTVAIAAPTLATLLPRAAA